MLVQVLTQMKKMMIKNIFNDFLHSNDITPRNFFSSNPTTPNNFGIINSYFNQNVEPVSTPQNNIFMNQFNSVFKTAQAQMTPNNLINTVSPMGNTNTSPLFLKPQNVNSNNSLSFSEMVNLTKKVFG